MLDSILWGNPTQKQLLHVEAPTPLEAFVPQVITFANPLNSSKATREELNTLVDYVAALKGDAETLRRYSIYDANMKKYWASVVIEHELGDKAVDMIDNLMQEALPFVYRLKYHFQRPRPAQLAAHYKLKLFPFQSFSSDSPSYPSEHVFTTHLICYVLGNNFPDKFDYFDVLLKDVVYSRQYMGLNYPSDCDFAQYCVETIVRDRDFKQRYGL